MPSVDFDSALRVSVQMVLERMFFAEPLPDPDPSNPDTSAPIQAEVTFEGDQPGTFGLAISRPAAGRIAADFLGLEQEQLTPLQLGQVVCEMANMICGSVLSQMESAANFRLASPQLVKAAESSPSSNTARCRATYAAYLPGGTFAATFATAGPVCP